MLIDQEEPPMTDATTAVDRIVASALVAELRDIRQRLADLDPGYERPYIEATASTADGVYGVLFRGRGEFRLEFGSTGAGRDDFTPITIHGVDYRGTVELRVTERGTIAAPYDERYRQPQAYIRRDELFSIAEPTPAAHRKLFGDGAAFVRALGDEVRRAVGVDRWAELDAEATERREREQVHRAAEQAGRAIDEALAALDGVA